MIISLVYQRGVAAQHDPDAVTLLITGRESVAITWRGAQRVRKILNDWVTLGLADWSMSGYSLRGDIDVANARLTALLETVKEVTCG
jgi:hypothetical protein